MPAGTSANARQFCQASRMLVTFAMPVKSIEVMPQQSRITRYSVVQFGTLSVGNAPTIDLHTYQVLLKFVALVVSMAGNGPGIELQLYQVEVINVALLVSIHGNGSLSETHDCHALVRLVTLLVSIAGNDVRLVQPAQVEDIVVVFPVSIAGKLASLALLYQVESKAVACDVSMNGMFSNS